MGNFSSHGSNVSSASQIATLEERVRRLVADVREKRIDRQTMIDEGMSIKRALDGLFDAADKHVQDRRHTLRKHVSFLLDSDCLLSDLEGRLRELEDKVLKGEISEQSAQQQGRCIWEATDRLALARDDRTAEHRRHVLQGNLVALMDSLLRMSGLEERLRSLAERVCIPRDAEQQATQLLLEANTLQLVPCVLGKRRDLINRIQAFFTLVTVKSTIGEIVDLEQRMQRLVQAVREGHIDRRKMAEEGMTIQGALDKLLVAEDDQQAQERRHSLRENISLLLDSDDHLSDLEEQLRQLQADGLTHSASGQSIDEAVRILREAAGRLVFARDDQIAQSRHQALRQSLDRFSPDAGFEALRALEEQVQRLEQDMRNNLISRRLAEEEATQISIAADNLEQLDTQSRERRRVLLRRIHALSNEPSASTDHIPSNAVARALSKLEEQMQQLEQDVRCNRISKRSADEEATQISIAADNLDQLDSQARGRRRLLLERIRLLSDSGMGGSGIKRPATHQKHGL